MRLDGTAGVGAGAWAITEDGGLLFPGAMTSVSQALVKEMLFIHYLLELNYCVFNNALVAVLVMRQPA